MPIPAIPPKNSVDWYEWVKGLDGAARSALNASLNLTDLPSPAAARTALGLAAVAASGQYSDLLGLPTVPPGYTDEQAQDAAAGLLTGGGHTGITFAYDDVGNRIIAIVTGASGGSSGGTGGTGGGTGGGTTTPTPVLTNTVIPQILGDPTVGNTVTADEGSWSSTPDSYTYQWTRAGNPISAATAKTYALVGADAGQKIAVVVTALKSGYTSGTATSATVTPSSPPSSGSTLSTEDGTDLTTEDGTTVLTTE